MMYKRGEGLSLNFIIIAILALIALIVIALFFTGGIAKLFGIEKGVSELTLTPAMRDLAESQCELYCTNENRYSYEHPSFSAEFIEQDITDCKDLLKESFDERCVVTKSCQPEDPNEAVVCSGLSLESTCEAKLGCEWK